MKLMTMMVKKSGLRWMYNRINNEVGWILMMTMMTMMTMMMTMIMADYPIHVGRPGLGRLTVEPFGPRRDDTRLVDGNIFV